jgi:hypothetical protein
VFLSYRGIDSSEIAGRIDDRLVARFGRRRVVNYLQTFPLGVDFREHIVSVIPACDAVLAVIGPDWLSSRSDGLRPIDDPRDMVRVELQCAFAHGVRIIPVLVGSARMPEARELPESIRKLVDLQSVSIRVDPDFHHDVSRLIAAL